MAEDNVGGGGGAEARARAQALPLGAYPSELEQAEGRLIIERRSRAGVKRDGPYIGVALSGGGIRSATFALGIFQSLARARLVRHIDILSTASGGGYFGAFLGALYQRPKKREEDSSNAQGKAETEHGSDVPNVVEERLSNNADPAIAYLRENGRFLAPAGTDDLLLGGAVLFRNWVAIQVVILSFLLFIFLSLELSTLALFQSAPELSDALKVLEARFVDSGVWLSPWLLPASLVLVLGAVPFGWSYWLIGRVWAILPNLLVVGVAMAMALSREEPSLTLGIGVALVGSLSLAISGVSAARHDRALLVPYLAAGTGALGFRLWRDPSTWPSSIAAIVCIALLAGWLLWSAEGGELDSEARALDLRSRAQHRVSVGLKMCLVVLGLLLALSAVDTLARSLYWAYARAELPRYFDAISAAVWAFFVAVSGVGRRIALAFGGGNGGKRGNRSSGWMRGALTAAALVVAFVVVTATSFASQWMIWEGQVPTRAPNVEANASVVQRIALGNGAPAKVELVVEFPACAGPKVQTPSLAKCPEAQILVDNTRRKPLDRGLIAWGVALLLSVVFGLSRVFLNQSTHQPLYGARLTRAYLGASNSRRFEREDRTSNDAPARNSATRVIPGDDIDAKEYFGWERRGRPHADASPGQPLHIINVTINETVDGRTHAVQRDRKGLGLALGPCALSAGVQHHLMPGLFDPSKDAAEPAATNSAGKWRVFRLPKSGPERFLPDEPLTLGKWAGISGAAFTTGVGADTSLGISLLAGLTNVRLGYWWKHGMTSALPKLRQLAAIFWVQSYLLRELLARFPGTQNKLWYLTDGGHFENLGAYELIRRKTPIVVLVDADADPNYEFGALGNLVRKARLDFGAEITFPERTLHPGASSYVGPLEYLRRGNWRLLQDGKAALESADLTGRSMAHAALGRIQYQGGGEAGWLLHIKPTLVDPSVDIADYHTRNPAFPHESTVDQFFDEEQWESYRKLGESIALRLFGDFANPTELAEMLKGKPPGG